MQTAVALARIHKRLAKIIVHFKIRGSDSNDKFHRNICNKSEKYEPHMLSLGAVSYLAPRNLVVLRILESIPGRRFPFVRQKFAEICGRQIHLRHEDRPRIARLYPPPNKYIYNLIFPPNPRRINYKIPSECIASTCSIIGMYP